jgi:hypothetical protein
MYMPRSSKPKPIQRPRYGIVSRTNVPFDEPLTPGLRKTAAATAIGFLHDWRDDLTEEHQRAIGWKRD